MAGKVSLVIAAAMLGRAAYALAIGVGIPRWINWTTAKVPADASDIGALVFFAVLILGGRNA